MQAEGQASGFWPSGTPARWLRAGAAGAALALLGGCVVVDTNEARQAQASAMVGRPEANLIQRLGVPTRSFQANGRRFLAYETRRTMVVPVPTAARGLTAGVAGVYVGLATFSPFEVEHSCDITYEVAQGVVRGWVIRGNDCE